MKNARAPMFRPPWAPSRAQQLNAFRTEQRRYNPQPSPAALGYDRDWAELRRRHLDAEPDCRMCAKLGRTTRAVIVDHIEPVRDAPDRRLDPTNLQSLCRPHHQQKSSREHARRRARSPT